ncbi:MAG TPA: hypothetical protein VKB19_11095, partial [Pedobacter sp.]|nr:hypothetical protein [Pedobacter sp.]
MSSISGIEKLSELLTAEEISQLSKAADRHKTQSKITFTILSATGAEVQIETVQDENKSGKYATEATLISRTTELFSKFLPGIVLIVNPVTFAPSPSSIVNTA